MKTLLKSVLPLLAVTMLLSACSNGLNVQSNSIFSPAPTQSANLVTEPMPSGNGDAITLESDETTISIEIPHVNGTVLTLTGAYPSYFHPITAIGEEGTSSYWFYFSEGGSMVFNSNAILKKIRMWANDEMIEDEEIFTLQSGEVFIPEQGKEYFAYAYSDGNITITYDFENPPIAFLGFFAITEDEYRIMLEPDYEYSNVYSINKLNTEANTNNNDEGTILFPFTISNNSITLKNGLNVHVDIEMIEGRYFVPDVLGGGVYDNNWQGKYQIRVYKGDDKENTLYCEPILIEFTGNEQQMNFSGEFSLVFDDYNNDENPDFTLGQFGNSNGNYYNLFSIDENGVVSKYMIDNDLYVSSHEFSIGFEKLTDISFSYTFYNNAAGEYIVRTYEWDGMTFIMVQN